MTLRSWFDLARRVVNLTVQLDARAGELRDVHKQVAYWKQLAGERWDEVQRLNGEVNAGKLAEPERCGMSNPVPSVVSIPLGSRDRANAVRLSEENSVLRAEVDRLRVVNGRLAARVGELEAKYEREYR